MPRARRRAPEARQSDFTDEHREFLETGNCDEWNFLCEPHPLDTTPEGRGKVVEAWQEHGAEITAEWIVSNPGSRPWAWWLVEHGMSPPHDEHEALERAGLLGDDELAALETSDATNET